jgi:hypothetical protein
VVAPSPVDHVPVGIIQMEEAGELFRGGFSGIAPVSTLLLFG